MPINAKLNYLRIAPRKVRLVADLIRGKTVEEAETLLSFLPQKSALPLVKLLKSAIASAKNNLQLEPANLYIAKIMVNEGPKLKRWRPRARGQAYEIQKKTSHIVLVLESKVKPKKKAKKVKTEEVKKEEKVAEKVEEKVVKEKPKFKPEFGVKKPKTEKGFRRIFIRRKPAGG